jgi:predicted RecA/RadA family phage recombinase
MAKNYVQPGDSINAAASDPATPASGDPVRVGEIAGVAITAEGAGDNATGETTIATKGVFNLSVKGVDAGGNSAVAVGDKLYYVDADTPKLSKKVAGHLFGKALGIVNSGATATIPVLLIQA